MLKASKCSRLLFIFTLFITTVTHANTDPVSQLFGIKINGAGIPVYDYKDFTYAYFEQNGKVSIVITFAQPVDDVKISPVHRDIQFVKKDRTIQFDLLQPEYTVVTVNKKQRLFLFAEEELQSNQSDTLKITDYVTKGDTGVSTQSIQKALDAASATGKQLVFTAGTYTSGSLFIHSNTKLFFEKGAVLKASENLADYVLNKEIGARIFITVKDAQNVVVNGSGIIDGSGRAIRDKFGDKGRIRLFTIHHSEKVALSGITLRDPAAWNTHIFKSQEVHIKHLKLLNDITVPTTDGFDPDASSGINIENCFAYCSDDNVAVKLTPRNEETLITKNIRVSGCVFLTLKSSLKIGTETRGASISDVLFENNDVIQADRGMAIYATDGAIIENVRYINNRFEESYLDLKQMAVQFRLNKRDAESRLGQIKNVLVKDCNFYVRFPKPSEVSGFDKDHKTEVVFDNLQIGGKKCLNISDADIQTAAFSDITFK